MSCNPVVRMVPLTLRRRRSMEVVKSVTMAAVLLVARQDLIAREWFDIRTAVLAISSQQPAPAVQRVGSMRHKWIKASTSTLLPRSLRSMIPNVRRMS